MGMSVKRSRFFCNNSAGVIARVIASLWLTAFAGISDTGAAETAAVDRSPVVAEFISGKITRRALEQGICRQIAGHLLLLRRGHRRFLEKQVLEKLLQRELLLAAARNRCSVLPRAKIDSLMQESKDQWRDRRAFKDMLRQRCVREDEFYRGIEDDLTIQYYLESRVFRSIPWDENEVERYYRERLSEFSFPPTVRVRQIFFRLRSAAQRAEVDIVQRRVDEVMTELRRDGANFVEIARQYSDGPRRNKGGDLGFFYQRQLAEPLSDAAFALDVGEISSPIRSMFGVHILRVEDKRAERVLPLVEVSDQIRSNILHEKQREVLRLHLADLWKAAGVIVYLD